MSHLGVCVGKWGAVMSEVSAYYWVSAMPFTLWLWWQWTANRAQAEAKSKRWWGRKASWNLVPFSEGGIISRKDTLFHVKILWNSEHMQGSYRSSVLRYHPELDGGQANTGTRQQGSAYTQKHWMSTAPPPGAENGGRDYFVKVGVLRTA